LVDLMNQVMDYSRILRRDRLTPHSVLRYQDFKLRRLVAYAHRHVPYYRALMDDAGLAPEDIRGIGDLADFPMTSKMNIKRAAASDLLSDAIRADRLLIFKTTGSTGVPLVVRRSKTEDFLLHLFRMRVVRSCGLRARDRFARIRGGDPDPVPLPWRLARALGLYRQWTIDTRYSPQENAACLLALRPDVLTGYNSSLARIARILTLDHGAVLPLRFVIGGADMLTPLLRRQIEKTFQARVYDNYGSAEIGLAGWECPESGLYHVCDDNVILEVLDKDGHPVREGEAGEVVVTNLHLRAMPFIRYRLEDIVTVGPSACPCGLPYRTLRTIEAKKQDYFRLPGGREFYPWAISLYVVDNASWVLQFELVQERIDRVVMRVVAAEPSPADEPARLREGIRPMLGPNVEFEIHIVPEIAPTPGGKFWVRRSLVNSMYEDNGA